MEPDKNQRHELGAFLRARREALPAPSTGRRRTPGCGAGGRSAPLGNVSTTWYVWAEQGRDISLSPQALARLAVALRLTSAERGYMFALAARLDPALPHEPEDQQLPPELADLPGTISSPAYVLDSCYTARSWNMPARELLAPWLKSGEFNLLRYVFLYPNARDFIVNWAARAGNWRRNFMPKPDRNPTPRRAGHLWRGCAGILRHSRYIGSVLRCWRAKGGCGDSIIRSGGL